jgi:hypothetical protein
MRDGRVDIDPDDDQLAADLQMLAWSMDSSQRIVLESKDVLRARGLGSPDHADAAAMAAFGDLVPDVWSFLEAAQGQPVRTTHHSLTKDLLDRPI